MLREVCTFFRWWRKNVTITRHSRFIVFILPWAMQKCIFCHDARRWGLNCAGSCLWLCGLWVIFGCKQWRGCWHCFLVTCSRWNTLKCIFAWIKKGCEWILMTEACNSENTRNILKYLEIFLFQVHIVLQITEEI